jgi:hypothetical protein
LKFVAFRVTGVTAVPVKYLKDCDEGVRAAQGRVENDVYGFAFIAYTFPSVSVKAPVTSYEVPHDRSRKSAVRVVVVFPLTGIDGGEAETRLPV